MAQESKRLELPPNEEKVFEIVYNESLDDRVLSSAEGSFTFDQLIAELQSCEGFKLHLRVAG